MASRSTKQRRPASTSAAEVIAGNDDLLTEILLCLPSKSLMRFKSVSKAWLSLISDPSFSLRWKPNRSDSGLFLRRYSSPENPKFKLEYVPIGVQKQAKRTRPPFRSLSFVEDPRGIKIVESCHGLLLCCSHAYVRPRAPNYYIYNPATKQFKSLPRPDKHVIGINLAFDPSKSSRYKVVCVCSASPPGHFALKIYSSETGTWRVWGDPFRARMGESFRQGAFWNGAIHWLSGYSESSLYFDIDNDQLRTMPMLPIQDRGAGGNFCYFGESGGHLHLIEFSAYFTTQFDVFEMERDYSKWFVKYRVDLDVVAIAFPELFQNNVPDRPLLLSHCKFYVLCLVRQEIEEESSLVLYIPGKVISYNFKDKTFKELCDLVLCRSDLDCLKCNRWLYVHQYIESLFRV